jgi:hypothetical protein
MLDRVRRGYPGVVVLSLACGPVVSDGDGSGTTRGEVTSGPSSPDASSEATGSSDTREGEEDTQAGTSGLDPVVGPESVYAEIVCVRVEDRPGPHLWIEAYLDGGGGPDCLPPPAVSMDLALVLINQWDGASGTFVFGDEHPHRAVLGLDDEAAEGTVRLEVAAPYALVSAHLDLSTSERAVTGDLDFSLCPPHVGDPPCP